MFPVHCETLALSCVDWIVQLGENTNRKLPGHLPDFWFRPNFDRGDTANLSSLINLIYHPPEQEFLEKKLKKQKSIFLSSLNRNTENFLFHSIVLRNIRFTLALFKYSSKTSETQNLHEKFFSYNLQDFRLIAILSFNTRQTRKLEIKISRTNLSGRLHIELISTLL